MTFYRNDAQALPSCESLSEIRAMVADAIDGKYQLIDFHTVSISVGDSIAVQKYENTFQYRDATYRQKGMTEWRLTHGKWLIVNDIGINY
jgi:hypothetical protein